MSDYENTGPIESPTQRQDVLEFIQQYGSIDNAQAKEHLGIEDLQGRIRDLRKTGHRIKTNWSEFTTRHGRKSRRGIYTLVENMDAVEQSELF